MLGLGAIGLAGALTLAALAAPPRDAAAASTYTPPSASTVVARVPERSPEELSARRTLAASPGRVEPAVELARANLARYRSLSDPRFLGRAQAALAPWWGLAEPPHDVLLLRAAIRQSIHDFDGARADLDRAVATRPADAQAHLARAVVAAVTADYARARESCAAVEPLAGPLVHAACVAPLDAIAGRTDEAYARLSRALAGARDAAPAITGWARTALAELALVRGDTDAAIGQLRAALELDAADVHARDLLADAQLLAGRPDEAAQLLAGQDAIDSHLVRRAIAERALRGADADQLAAAMRERIAAAAARGDRTHAREEAMFALSIEGDTASALRLAQESWGARKGLADARLLAAAAVAARDAESAKPVHAWARQHGLRDAQLERSFTQLALTPAPARTPEAR